MNESKKGERYSSDEPIEGDLSSILVLKKNGKINEDFNSLINLILKKLEEAGIINEEFTKEVLKKTNEFVTELYSGSGIQYTLFTLPFKANMLKEVALLYDNVKKEIQSLIEKDPKYKNDYELFNTIHYKLGDKEKIIPIDFDEILLKIYQQVSGLRIKIYKQDILTKKMTEMIINKGFKGINWYVVFRFGYEFSGLTHEFFDKFLEKLLKIFLYLKKQKLIPNPFDPNDVAGRYLKAIEDFKNSMLTNESLIKELKNAGFLNSKIKLLIEEVEKRIPKTFIFVVSCLPMELNEFKKIQERLINELRTENLHLEYEVILTTNPYEGLNYGCFIQPRFDLAKLPKK